MLQRHLRRRCVWIQFLISNRPCPRALSRAFARTVTRPGSFTVTRPGSFTVTRPGSFAFAFTVTRPVILISAIIGIVGFELSGYLHVFIHVFVRLFWRPLLQNMREHMYQQFFREQHRSVVRLIGIIEASVVFVRHVFIVIRGEASVLPYRIQCVG